MKIGASLQLFLLAGVVVPQADPAAAADTFDEPSLDLGYVKITITDSMELTYPIFVGKTEVTNDQYLLCVRLGGCSRPEFGPHGYNWEPGKPIPLGSSSILHKLSATVNARPIAGRGQHPVNGVYANEARQFCEWAGASLPTAIEWDAIASAVGTPWPDGSPPSEKYAHIGSEDRRKSPSNTAKVCSKPAGASKHGICDLWGNVWEWTDTRPKLRMPPGQSLMGEPFMVKGGGLSNPPRDMSNMRYLLNEYSTRERRDTGFRCVIRAKEAEPLLLSTNRFARNRYLRLNGSTECQPVSDPSSDTIRDCFQDCDAGAQGACELAIASVLAVDGTKMFRSKVAKLVTPMLERRCKLGGAASCDALANWLQAIGDEAGSLAMRNHATDGLNKGCSEGDASSCSELGLSLIGKPEAVRPLTTACESGIAVACMRLGGIFLGGMGATRDLKAARDAYVAACRMGDQSSCLAAKTIKVTSGPNSPPSTPDNANARNVGSNGSPETPSDLVLDAGPTEAAIE